MVCKIFKEKNDRLLLEEVNGIMEGYFIFVNKKVLFYKVVGFL